MQPCYSKSTSIWGCKNLFCILKHYFIYFTNPFYNSSYIPIFIFTYNPIKLYKLTNKIIKSILLFLFSTNIFFSSHKTTRLNIIFFLYNLWIVSISIGGIKPPKLPFLIIFFFSLSPLSFSHWLPPFLVNFSPLSHKVVFYIILFGNYIILFSCI